MSSHTDTTRLEELLSYHEQASIGKHIYPGDEYNMSLDGSKELIKDYFAQELQKAREERDEEIIKMLWSIHEDENDEEMEAWNRSLDLGIFRIKNPDVSDSLSHQFKKV